MYLTSGQRTVLRAFKDFGAMDDVPLTVFVHHIAESSMSSSGIRSRRAELVRKGLLEATGIKHAKSGRKVAIHGITAAGKAELRRSRTSARAKAVA